MAARASTCYDCGFWVRTDRQVDRASTWSLLLKSPAPFSCRFAPGGQHIVVKTPPARPNWRESAQLPGERTASSSADQDPTSQKVRKTQNCFPLRRCLEGRRALRYIMRAVVEKTGGKRSDSGMELHDRTYHYLPVQSAVREAPFYKYDINSIMSNSILNIDNAYPQAPRSVRLHSRR